MSRTSHGAPQFRQLGQLTGHDRHHVSLEITALVEEGADRREVGRDVEMPPSRIKEAAAENCVTRRVKRGNFVMYFVMRRVGDGNFVMYFVTPLPRALACRVIGILTLPAPLAPWDILKCPSRPNRRSDDFLCGAGTSERFDNFGEQGGARHLR
jgi:hypothetical protein